MPTSREFGSCVVYVAVAGLYLKCAKAVLTLDKLINYNFTYCISNSMTSVAEVRCLITDVERVTHVFHWLCLLYG